MARTFLNASAQDVSSAPITNSQTTLTLGNTANFGAPTVIRPTSVIILPPGYDPLNPLAGGFEYQPITNNDVGTNTLTINGGVRAAYAGTTPRAFGPGATVAAVWLAEDISFPELFATLAPSSGSSVTQTIPSVYRQLEVMIDLAVSGTNTSVGLQLNSDVGAHYYWSSAGDGSDATRAGNGGVAVTAATIGFIGTATSLSWNGRLWLNDIQQATRPIAWNFRGMYNNVAAPHVISLHGGGMWFPTPLAAVTSVTIFISGGTITSANIDFRGQR